MTASQPSIPSRIARSSPRSPATSSQPSVATCWPFSRVADQADDLVAARAQLAHDVAADESRSSRDEDLHGPNPIPAGAAPYNRSECSDRETAARPRRATARSTATAPASPTRGPASGRWRSASSTAASDGEPLAELKELLRTAGVATAGEATQQRPKPDPDRYFGRGRLDELKARDRRLRRQPGRLRRRAGAAPGAQPGGGARACR